MGKEINSRDVTIEYEDDILIIKAYDNARVQDIIDKAVNRMKLLKGDYILRLKSCGSILSNGERIDKLIYPGDTLVLERERVRKK